MSLHHTLLGLLSYEPMTGYQLKQFFEGSINHFWNAHISQIYRELTSMEKKGLVTFCIEPQDGKPDKKVYSVTPEGMASFKKWLREFPEMLDETVRSEFLARIFFASYMDVPDLIYELRRFLRKQQEQLCTYKEIEAHIQSQQEHGEAKAI